MTASIRTEEGGYQGGEEGGVILPRKACRIISNRSIWRAGELYFHRGWRSRVGQEEEGWDIPTKAREEREEQEADY